MIQKKALYLLMVLSVAEVYDAHSMQGELGIIETKNHYEDAFDEEAFIEAAMFSYMSQKIYKKCEHFLQSIALELNKKHYYGRTLLVKVCARKYPNINIIALLLHYKADPNIADNSTKNPLDYCLVNTQCNKEILKLLILHGAKSANYTGNDIHKICSYNLNAVLKSLLESKANVNALNQNGKTPLHIACIKNNIEAVVMLLDNGADVTIQDKVACTALHFSIYCPAIMELLLKHRASPNVVDNRKKRTPLFHASCNWPEAVALLLKHGADPLVYDIRGNTPLHMACRAIKDCKHDPKPTLKKFIAIANMLIETIQEEYGKESVLHVVNSKNSDGFTPPMLAQEYWNCTVGRKYLETKKDAIDELADRFKSNVSINSFCQGTYYDAMKRALQDVDVYLL